MTAHSFVRGNWRNSKESSPIILAKCCHDLDMIRWLAGDSCTKISSFGRLKYFTKENAPQDTPSYCLDGCPLEKECPYHVSKLYLTDNIGWPTDMISSDLSLEGREKSLKRGNYGRCVYALSLIHIYRRGTGCADGTACFSYPSSLCIPLGR